MKKMNIEDVLEVSKDYYVTSVPKFEISKALKEQLDNKGKTIRGLAKEVGMKHHQIIRVTSGENYTVNTLLRILDGLDMELVARPKQEMK